MKKPISEQALNQQLEQLSATMTPQRDLWQGIEHAINQTPQDEILSTKPASNTVTKITFAPAAWAASLVVAVLVTWLAITPPLFDQTDLAGLTTEKNLIQGTQELSTDVAALMHENFIQQKQAMLVSFGTRDTIKISPLMEKQLAELASARQAIEKALVADKNNADLLNLLRFTQQQELNLLQQLYAPKWQSI